MRSTWSATRHSSISLDTNNYRRFVDLGQRIKRTAGAEVDINHLKPNDLESLYGTIFTGSLYDNEVDSRTVCVFADREVDRCPTGAGSVLDLYSIDRGDFDPDEPFIVESVVGLRFTDHILEMHR